MLTTVEVELEEELDEELEEELEEFEPVESLTVLADTVSLLNFARLFEMKSVSAITNPEVPMSAAV